jgi:hypothetical protein
LLTILLRRRIIASQGGWRWVWLSMFNQTGADKQSSLSLWQSSFYENHSLDEKPLTIRILTKAISETHLCPLANQHHTLAQLVVRCIPQATPVNSCLAAQLIIAQTGIRHRRPFAEE